MIDETFSQKQDPKKLFESDSFQFILGLGNSYKINGKQHSEPTTDLILPMSIISVIFFPLIILLLFLVSVFMYTTYFKNAKIRALSLEKHPICSS